MTGSVKLHTKGDRQSIFDAMCIGFKGISLVLGSSRYIKIGELLRKLFLFEGGDPTAFKKEVVEAFKALALTLKDIVVDMFDAIFDGAFDSIKNEIIEAVKSLGDDIRKTIQKMISDNPLIYDHLCSTSANLVRSVSSVCLL